MGMTLEEAIRSIMEFATELRHIHLEARAIPIELGIEALKKIRTERQYAMHHFERMLPGETKEQGGTMPITMSKAIEVLDLNMKEAHKSMPEDVKDSLDLAINTMRTVKHIRKGGEWSWHGLLPNEAPEPEE